MESGARGLHGLVVSRQTRDAAPARTVDGGDRSDEGATASAWDAECRACGAIERYTRGQFESRWALRCACGELIALREPVAPREPLAEAPAQVRSLAAGGALVAASACRPRGWMEATRFGAATVVALRASARRELWTWRAAVSVLGLPMAFALLLAAGGDAVFRERLPITLFGTLLLFALLLLGRAIVAPDGRVRVARDRLEHDGPALPVAQSAPGESRRRSRWRGVPLADVRALQAFSLGDGPDPGAGPAGVRACLADGSVEVLPLDFGTRREAEWAARRIEQMVSAQRARQGPSTPYRG